MKGGHAALREGRHLFPDVDFTKIPNVDKEGNRLCLDVILWTAESINRYATTANRRWQSPYEVFFSRPPQLLVVPLFQRGMMRVVRVIQSDLQSVPCYYLNNGDNHSASIVKVIEGTTSGMYYTEDIVQMIPLGDVRPPALAKGGRLGGLQRQYPPTIRGSSTTCRTHRHRHCHNRRFHRRRQKIHSLSQRTSGRPSFKPPPPQPLLPPQQPSLPQLAPSPSSPPQPSLPLSPSQPSLPSL